MILLGLSVFWGGTAKPMYAQTDDGDATEESDHSPAAGQPSSRPASQPAGPSPTVRAAALRIYRGEIDAGKEQLRAAPTDHETDPLWNLAYALAMAYRPGGEKGVLRFLDRAMPYRRNFVEANMIAMLAAAKLGDEEEFRRRRKLVERHRFEDSLFRYALALALGLRNDWPAARKQFQFVVDADGPLAASAARKIKQLDAWWTDLQPKLREAEAQLAARQAEQTDLQASLAAKKAAGRDAEAERETLKADYLAQREVAEQAYEQQAILIEQQYQNELPPAALATTNPTEYDRQVRAAKDKRLQRYQLAARQRDLEYAKIDTAFRPLVNKIDAKIAGLKGEVVALQRKLALQPRRITLAERQRDQLLQTAPFDLDRHWREVAFWIAAGPLELSAEDLAEPPSPPTEAPSQNQP